MKSSKARRIKEQLQDNRQAAVDLQKKCIDGSPLHKHWQKKIEEFDAELKKLK